VKQSSSFSRKHRNLSLLICVLRPVPLGVEYRIWGLMHCRAGSDALYKHRSATPATWSSASLTDAQEITKRHRQSCWSKEKAVTCKHECKLTSLWTSAKLKPALFRANTLHNRLFSEPPTVYRRKHVVSRHLHRSYLKANKVNKSEGIRLVEDAYHLRKCNWFRLPKIIRTSPCFFETTACQSWRVFETQCSTSTILVNTRSKSVLEGHSLPMNSGVVSPWHRGRRPRISGCLLRVSAREWKKYAQKFAWTRCKTALRFTEFAVNERSTF